MHADEESIFEQALTYRSSSARVKFLAEACGSDLHLLERVNALLRSYESSDFLEYTSNQVDLLFGKTEDAVLDDALIGPYRILELLGEGGMGEVYLAEHAETGSSSKVAIKIIKAGMNSRQVIARFRLEQESLKRINHPNVSRFLEAGLSDSGRAYFVMELVQGTSITRYCDRECLPVPERVRLALVACRAIQHAHSCGIVHRDLKPENVLITVRNDAPVVKVIDFGVAKWVNEGQFGSDPTTRFTQLIGTPKYMSPEQLRSSSDVDCRSDVYSMGILLDELIAGSTFIDDAESDATLRNERGMRISGVDRLWPSQRLARMQPGKLAQVCQFRGATQRQVLRQIRGELDWIVIKATKYAREKRYDSLEALADDLQNYLDDRPIKAHRPSLTPLIIKWAKRNRALVAVAIAACMLASTAVAIQKGRQIIRAANTQRQQVEASKLLIESELKHQQFARDIQNAWSSSLTPDPDTLEKLLDKYRQMGPDFSNHFALNYLSNRVLKPIHRYSGLTHKVLDMDVSTDGRWVCDGDSGGNVIIWDTSSGEVIQQLHCSAQEMTRTRFSPDGKKLATAGQDHTVRIWNTSSWTMLASLTDHERTINGLAWSPDSQNIGSGDRDGIVRIWNVSTRACIKTLPTHAEVVRHIAWSPDGKCLATADGNCGVHVWNVSDWSERTFVDNFGKGTLAISFSAEGRYLAFGGYAGELVIFDLLTLSVIQRSEADGQIWSLAFYESCISSGISDVLVAGLGNGCLQVFKRTQEKQSWQSTRIGKSTGVNGSLRSLAWSPSQDQLFVAAESDKVVHSYSQSALLDWNYERLDSFPLGILRSLNLLLTADENGENSSLRKLDSLDEEFRIPFPVSSLCRPEYTNAKNLVAIACEEGDVHQVKLYRPGTWELHTSLDFSVPIRSMSFSLDGSRLAVAGEQGRASIYNLQTGEVINLEQGRGDWESRAEYSPGGRFLIIGPAGGRKLACLNSESNNLLRVIETESDWKRFAYHPIKDSLVVAQVDRISVWSGDLATLQWTSPRFRSDPSSMTTSMSFSPDGFLVAMISTDGIIEVWDWESRAKIFTIPTQLEAKEPWIAFANSQELMFGCPSKPTLFNLGNAKHSAVR